MRVPILLVSVGLTGILGCGGADGPCPPPEGCLSAARSSGTCACTEWTTVSTETAQLPFVVLGVRYPPAGTASVVRYGTTWDPAQIPQSDSAIGTTIRAVIRGANGADRVAGVGALPAAADLERSSATTLRAGRSGGIWTLSNDLDLRTAGSDVISVWTNAVVTVSTSYVGDKTVHWSLSPRCFIPVLCGGADYLSLSTALARGGVSVGGPADDFLASLGPDGRAALHAFDAREAGAVAFPRYQWLTSVPADETVTRSVSVTWQPCAAPAAFEVLAETTVPLAGGDTFVLQYGVQSDAACTAQRPGVLVGTSTPGCRFRAEVLVDRLFGTVLMQPSAVSPACTTD